MFFLILLVLSPCLQAVFTALFAKVIQSGHVLRKLLRGPHNSQLDRDVDPLIGPICSHPPKKINSGAIPNSLKASAFLP